MPSPEGGREGVRIRRLGEDFTGPRHIRYETQMREMRRLPHHLLLHLLHVHSGGGEGGRRRSVSAVKYVEKYVARHAPV